MKKSIGTIFAALFLATAPVAFVNAQTPLPPPSPAQPVTQEQFQRLHDQQQRQARQMRTMNTHIRDLGAAQAKQGSRIDSLNGTVNDLRTGTTKAIDDVQQQQENSARAAQATMSTMQRWIAALGGLAFLCVIAIVLHSVLARRRAKRMITREEIGEMIAKKTPPIVREVVIREMVYVNSSVPELRNAWKKLRQEIPTGPAFLQYAQRFEKDLAKGYDMEGLVDGYRVIFDDTKPIDGQTPKWFYNEERIPFKELTRHGLDILRRSEKSESNVTIMNGPDDLRTLEAAISGTEVSRHFA